MIKEPGAPVDIGKEQIKEYKAQVEQLLTSYIYANKPRSLPDLLLEVDPEEAYVMSDLERDTYITVREGMQIFKAVAEKLSGKTGLRDKLAAVAGTGAPDAEVRQLRDFCYTFAAYAASLYVSKKLDTVIRKAAGNIDAADKPDLSALVLDCTKPEETTMRMLLVPIYAQLMNHVENGRQVFKTPLEFPVFVKDVFDKYIELARTRKDAYPTLVKEHLEPYNFRIMDGFVVLQGYEDKSTPHIAAVEQKVSFQRIESREIVGNRAAKRKMARYAERLALYDPQTQTNPILELGGLSWSVLLDGLPGTGKSSMFRLAMTILSDICTEIGLKHHIFTVDQSVKDEYYGKTGKNLLERLTVTNDAAAISLGVFDDIDLLTTKRDDAQGADNDINNILMQYFDGVFTVRRGNVINFAASNKPTGVDEALRNRFNERLLVDGPVTPEDFADMVVLKMGKMIGRDLLKMENGEGYTPFATQDVREEGGIWSGGDVADYAAAEFVKRFQKATILDFGKFMKELKDKNPRITGRSAQAVIEAIKERCADFDIPREWFSDRALFLEQPSERKTQMLLELYTPITPDILFQEAQRYFDSEQRYAVTEAETRITEGYNALVWQMESELRHLEEQWRELTQDGKESDVHRLQELRALLHAAQEQKLETIRRAVLTPHEAEGKEKGKGKKKE